MENNCHKALRKKAACPNPRWVFTRDPCETNEVHYLLSQRKDSQKVVKIGPFDGKVYINLREIETKLREEEETKRLL